MQKTLFFIAILVFFVACGKDKFNTKPTLKFVSVNSKTIRQNEDLVFRLNVTDLEGDLQDSIFVLKRVRNCSQGSRNDKYVLPVFPTKKNLEVDIQVGYTYGLNGSYPGMSGPLCNRNDSVTYRFVIKDKAKNLSDTVNSPEIVIIKP